MGYHAHVYDFATPTPASRYFLFPAIGGGSAAISAACLQIATGFPPLHLMGFWAFGWGLAAIVPTMIVTIYSVGNERTAYFEKQGEQEAQKTYQEMSKYEALVQNATEEAVLEPAESPSSKNGFLTVVVKDEDTGTGADCFRPTWALWHMARNGGTNKDKPMSEGAWTGRGKPFSVDEFRALRDWLFGEGLAEWNNERAHAQGWHLRARARAMIRGLAEVNDPPTHF